MNLLDGAYVGHLIARCALRRDEKACRTFDLYVALARIVARLEDELKDVDIDWPLGPDPVPDFAKDLLAGGDSDPAPARIFPTAGFSADRERLRFGLHSARQLRKALTQVVSTLDENIKELEQRVGR